jgi:hypothetical protein
MSLKLRGAGDEMETDASRPQVSAAAAQGESSNGGGGGGELFDALLQHDNPVDFLADTYARGDSAMKEQAAGYMALLMSEDGFLNNMTPLQLLHLAVRQPDLVRACSRALPESDATEEDTSGALHILLAGLPEAIDVLSLCALLKVEILTTQLSSETAMPNDDQTEF